MAGIYSDTLKNKIGCDSLIKHVTLTQLAASDTIKIYDSIYSRQNYMLPWGKIVNRVGFYSDTTHSFLGCDSLVKIVTLTLKSVVQQTKNQNLCYGKTLKLLSGFMVTATGVYYDTLRYLNGADSVKVIYNVDVSAQVPIVKTFVKTLCPGQSYTLLSGKIINSAGLYKDTLKYISGCDSIIENVNIVYQVPSTLSVNKIICPGQSYTLSSGKIINTAGVCNDTLRSIFGCDSVIIIINLSIQSPVSVFPNTITICAGKSTILKASGSTVYLWSTGSTTAIVTVSPDSTTTYSVTGTTAGCVSAANATVFVTQNPVVSVNSQTICAGQAATLTATGANSYLWSDNSTDNPLIDSPATTTNYTVTGTIAGCKATAIANVKVIQVPAIVVNSSTICLGKSAILIASGGSNYTWSSGGSTNSITVSPLSTSTYVVSNTIVGCSKVATATVTVNPLPIVKVNSITICKGQSATLTASGATSYNWSNAATTNPIVVSPANTITYTVTGNKFGCTATVVSTVSINAAPVILVNSDTICVGETAILTASGGVSYAWSNGSTTTSIKVSPPTVTSYSVTGFNSVGCYANALTKVIIGSTPVAAFVFSPDPAGILNPNITFTDQSKPNVNYWRWDFGDGITLEPNISNPVHTYPSAEAVYTVTLRVQNPELCSDEVTHTVVIGQDFTFFIPSAFTPDDDNVNDGFGAKGGGIVKFELLIFDRWGNLVFSADDISKTWDGKTNSRTGVVLQDVYVWRVTLTDIFKKEHKYIGTVTVLNGK
jgi:gliding motility-associated-like protein